jgi:hypothetical protein
VADDADQPLPRLAFLVAQRAADVGEHQELMGPAALPERRAPHFPAARRAGKRDILDPGRLAREAGPQTELVGGAAEQLLGRLRQQPLAGAIDQTQRVRAVEGEDGDVDFDHHRPQQRAGLERSETLIVQRRGEDVDFEHHRAERIVAAGAAGADREVAFAQRRQQVGQGLQRQHHAVTHAERAPGPHSDDEHGEGPLDFRSVIAGPEQDQRDDRGGEACRQGEKQDALVEAQP